ncbi:MAG: NAD(P)H-hydrate dehydratase [Oscillospiraceae bacterium]|nr:NAD(P)H-hydrate dehydratase [Oscillospiraceae bacterium]
MKYVVTNLQMKKAEEECDRSFLSYSRLMKNAGTAAADHILGFCDNRTKAVILCGSGNNGGDGFVIAKILRENNIPTEIILANGEPKTDTARGYFDNSALDWTNDKDRCKEALSEANLAADCVFGTGFHGKLPEKIAEIMKSANQIPLKFAVDVPSGVDSDTGEFDENCFKPTHTLVLAAMKKGLISPNCVDVLGKVELLDIGIPDECYKEYEAFFKTVGEDVLPERLPSANKGSFGRLLNIAGSLYYCGAAAMSTKAALRMGTGLCTLAAPISVVKILASSIYETTYLPLCEDENGFIAENCAEKIAEILPRMNAVSIGCGLGNNEQTRALTEFVIKNAYCPIIIDADGINSISANIDILKARTGDTVITPHPLEFSRISGLSVNEIQRDRISAAREFSEKYGVAVLLKGAYTVVANGKEVWVNSSGNAALAKGGSGDVLTGIIASMMAQGVPAKSAAVEGAYIHGKTADELVKTMPKRRVLASDIIENL